MTIYQDSLLLETQKYVLVVKHLLTFILLQVGDFCLELDS